MSKALDTADWGQYQPKRKNIIINGNMNIWQRATSFTSVINGQWVADRIQYLRGGVGFVDVSQSTDHPLISSGKSMLITVNTADASIASTDTYGLQTKIEGYDYQRMDNNSCVLSFWVKTNITGTYYISLTNEGAPPTHSYVSAYTVNVSNTWEKKSIIFTPGTLGTFNFTNGEGLRVRWSMGDGSTSQTSTLDAWQSGNFRSGTSGVNFMSTIGNSFRLTDIQIEVGSEATDFEYRSIAEELVLCQRYYEEVFSQQWSAVSGQSRSIVNSLSYKVEKRSSPTIIRLGDVVTSSEGGTRIGAESDASGLALYKLPGDSSPAIIGGKYSIDAEL